MNEIIKPEATAVAFYGDGDPFARYADSIRPGSIVGKLLKFVKGDYLLGELAQRISEGTVTVAVMDQLLTGWVHWENGKTVDERMVLVASGQVPPRRHELGDLDPATWGTDNAGKPRDPWQFSAYLPMLFEDGNLCTFCTSSRGGHGAIGALSRAYARHRGKAPDELPRISLRSDSYQHPNREYGRVKTPLFELVGWEAKDRVVAALAEAGVTPAEPDPLPPIAKDLGDEVPF